MEQRKEEEYILYKNGYRLFIAHSMDHKLEHKHVHTLEIYIFIEMLSSDTMLSYTQIDGIMLNFLRKYDGKYLNEMDEWQVLSPTIENMGNFFYLQLSEILEKRQYRLIALEISENPLRVYRVSETLG